MKQPVGLLGMSDEELAELFSSGKHPERTIEILDRPFGLSLVRLNESAKCPDLPSPEGFAAAIRDYWRLVGRQESREEARLEAREALRRAERSLAKDDASPVAEKPSDKPHAPLQAERDRDEILADMARGLTLSAEKKEKRKRLKKEAENQKTISNRLYEASRLVRKQLAATNS
jgi:hypothetical protein